MTRKSVACPNAPTPAAPAIAAYQPTLPPLDAVGIMADLAGLRAVIAEAARRYSAALHRDTTGDDTLPRQQLSSPAAIYRYVRADMEALDHEELHVVLLDTKNQPIDVVPLYRGTLNSSVVRIGELFRAAIVANAANIVIVHNHPSSDPTPSPEDVRITAEAVKAGQLLDIEVLDHVIVGRPCAAAGNAGYVSLKERGLGFGGGR